MLVRAAVAGAALLFATVGSVHLTFAAGAGAIDADGADEVERSIAFFRAQVLRTTSRSSVSPHVSTIPMAQITRVRFVKIV